MPLYSPERASEFDRAGFYAIRHPQVLGHGLAHPESSGKTEYSAAEKAELGKHGYYMSGDCQIGISGKGLDKALELGRVLNKKPFDITLTAACPPNKRCEDGLFAILYSAELLDTEILSAQGLTERMFPLSRFRTRRDFKPSTTKEIKEAETFAEYENAGGNHLLPIGCRMFENEEEFRNRTVTGFVNLMLDYNQRLARSERNKNKTRRGQKRETFFQNGNYELQAKEYRSNSLLLLTHGGTIRHLFSALYGSDPGSIGNLQIIFVPWEKVVEGLVSLVDTSKSRIPIQDKQIVDNFGRLNAFYKGGLKRTIP